jgi:peroxiredoxin/mono/diheme cytochrome c family protein
MRRVITCLALAALSLATQCLSAADREGLIGRQIANFELKDFRGKDHSLSDLADSKVVVVLFVGCECPLAKLYGPRMAELAAKYQGKGVAVLGIDSNRQDSITEMAAYARIHQLDFPILKDLGNVVADQFGATRTPEAFVLDQDRKIRYCGRIDDQYGFSTGSGYQKPQLNRADLSQAIDELLADKTVSIATTDLSGCLIGRVHQAQENAEVTYSNQIARLMQNRCVECHRTGQIAPFALTNYDEVAGWAEMIEETVNDRRMPPWHANPEFGHFSNDLRLTDDELALIHAWVAAGAPEGNPQDLPVPKQYAEGWMMPEEPDVVVHMADEAVEVPAEGTVEYKYFEVDPGFTEDKWVQVAECLPDNRGVVHHIIVFVRPPSGTGAERRNRDARGFHFLAGFAPGTRPFVLPDGMAKKIPAGSKLVFQLHYTPNGSPQKDRSSIGLKFVKDPASVTQQVATTNAINHLFEIPAHADNHPVKATRKIARDTTLLSMFPHMHLRGKSFHYEAWYPDGTKEVLLDVPRYDFNWQNSFILKEPKLLPKGTKIACLAHFDNSENNLANPNPGEPVRWGDQTWEEMMIGWFDIALPVDEIGSVLDAPATEDDAPGADAEAGG